jgi:hypothetical protein
MRIKECKYVEQNVDTQLMFESHDHYITITIQPTRSNLRYWFPLEFLGKSGGITCTGNLAVTHTATTALHVQVFACY